MNTYKVYTLKLAHKLIQEGFRCVETLPNKDKPWFNVYCFEDSQELRSYIRAYRSK